MLARVKRVLNDYTLASELDRQFGDLPVGLRKMMLLFLNTIHGIATGNFLDSLRAARVGTLVCSPYSDGRHFN